jgi:serine/threonine protein kinase
MLGNRYHILESIGDGGMAVVYKAKDMMLERTVAVKLLRQRYSRNANFRTQFHEEAKSAASLSHQNIVTVYDFGLDNRRLYIVMEYVPGTDLKTIINSRKRFPVLTTLQLITQACFGIGHAHRKGLIHCDVKPHNMLVTPDRQLKVTDFGIARALASIQPDEQHDMIWGSPQYISPEQAAGEPPSTASDVYSLGVILYEMLAGCLPFESDDPYELSRMHQFSAPLPPSRHNPKIPESLERVVMKTLAKNPAERYRTADHLGRILTTIMKDEEKEKSRLETIVLPQKQNQGITTPLPSKTETTPIRQSRLPDKQEAVPDRSGREGFLGIDWGTIGLGLIAAIFVSGLLPFWIFIYLSLRSP